MSEPSTLTELFLGFSANATRPSLIHRTGVRRRVMDYAALDQQARRMATLLAQSGVGKGDRIGLWGPNSPWWGVAFWGILLRGAIVVPLDFSSEGARTAEVLAHAGVRLLVMSQLKGAAPSAVEVLILEELPWRLAPLAPQLEPVVVAPEEIAELVYTSGTTGIPKGVILSHRNLCANLGQLHRHLPVLDPSMVFLSLLPLSHLFEQTAGFLAPLSRGASIVYLGTIKPEAILEALAEEGIAVVVTVPQFLQLLRRRIEEGLAASGIATLFNGLRRCASGWSRALRRLLFWPVQRRFGSRFRFFVSGGGALDPELFRFWDELGFTVLEGYGLTECSPVLAANRLDRQVAGAVGPALPGVGLRIVEGEVQAQGANVFSGYYQNPSATASAFTADGWFRTGDLGTLDAQGWLRLHGRSKELIVTAAGVNVSPEGIEALLSRLPGVRAACVIGLDRGRGEEVHAVIIPDRPGRSLEAIVAAANARLDPLERITGCTLWPEADFPRTPTLKVRKFLVRERLLASKVVTATPPGDRLVDLIVAATGCAPAEVGEERYLVSELGLTSIARLELVSAIERHFRVDLDESLIDPQTTVARLRALIQSGAGAGSRDRARFASNRAPARLVRRLLDYALHFPLLRLVCTVEAQGLEQLAGLSGPVLFVANHVSYLDQPVILRALPPAWRYCTATAAWEEYFFGDRPLLPRLWRRFAYEYLVWGHNIFPLSQEHGFRSALRFMGRLVDQQVNVLIFPEGERTRDGQLLPFRQGLGIMAEALDIPVVPIRLCGLEAILPRNARFPHRGRVEVRFGSPLRFSGERPEAIVQQVRAAIAGL